MATTRRRKKPEPKSSIVTIDAPVQRGNDARAVVAQKPVLAIHSSFRTSSTWLWSKLREARTTMSFYEVFNEMLATMKPAGALALDPSGWHSKHPETAAYFIEFLPLLQAGGGIEGFTAEMATQGFIPRGGIDGSLSIAERGYLEKLVTHARRCQRMPVLTCTRTIGRAAAIAEHFNARSVLVYRNLFHQWGSYSEQSLTGNDFFLDTTGKIIADNTHDPFMALLAESLGEDKDSIFDERALLKFALLHLYLYARTYDVYDRIIDVNTLTYDAAYRESAQQWLGDLVGQPVDLTDARMQFGTSVVSFRSMREFRDTIEQFVKMILPYCRSADAARFTEQATASFLDEVARNEFYASGLRSIVVGKATGQSAGSDGRAQALAVLRQGASADAGLVGSLGGAEDPAPLAALEAELAARAEIQAQAHESARQSWDVERSQLHAQTERATADAQHLRDELRSVHASASEQHHALGGVIAAREAEIAALKSQLADCNGQFDVFGGQIAEHMAEVGSLTMRLLSGNETTKELQDAHAALVAERDALGARLAEGNAEAAAAQDALAHARADVERINAALVAKTEEFAAIGLTAADAERLLTRATTAEAMLAAMEDARLAERGERDELARLLAAQTGEGATLQAEVAALKSKAATRQAEVAALKSKATTLQAEIDALKATIAEQKAEIDALITTMQDARQELSYRTQALANLQASLR